MVKPVTETADVAVKSAVTRSAPPGFLLAMGSINRAVPNAIATMKTTGMIRAGVLRLEIKHCFL
jgi:hypothetical protein